MSQISRLLRDSTGNGLSFWCPGCDNGHRIQHGDGDGERWTWNGKVDAPTFQPSVLVRGIREGMSDDDWREYDALYEVGKSEAVLNSRFATRCHSFVTDGCIQFLTDCTHALAGQTVPLPDWPENRAGD